MLELLLALNDLPRVQNGLNQGPWRSNDGDLAVGQQTY